MDIQMYKLSTRSIISTITAYYVIKLSQNIHIMIPHKPYKLQLDTTSILGVRAMDVGVGLCHFFDSARRLTMVMSRIFIYVAVKRCKIEL